MIEKRPGEAVSEAEREIEAVICAVEPWAGRDLRYGPVHGGISNSNWRVRIAGQAGSYFVKVPGRGTEMFIDRKAAAEASRRAHSLGIGPAVYGYLDERGVEIADFMEGRRSCTNRDFLDPDVRRSVLGLYRRFNDSGLLSLTKTVFDMVDEHVDQVRELGGALPADFVWLHHQYRLARAALEASGIDLVPCFNDPMPGNFMVAPDRSMMLIDYEYAANNDRCYELGIWCGEMFFSDAVEAEVIEEYFGRFDPRLKARLVVHKVLADVKWGTWAMVQNVVSALDFDFYKYGVWKYMRARSVMQTPQWVEHLRAV
ncbi:choline/ethanolamine kinase family protein [Mesorhizobium sp.]|uniref:choline/ethanolamine kinase family protein n=1 Tax=Mesorhizobium sp. TaxID=1871066 RepID=UPI00257D6CD5|nr:choline/ethanolamine kinase family protein [Mesorhizobium sp.]